jgi:ankyrin repeat protein
MKHCFNRMREREPEDLIVSFFFHGQGTILQRTLLGLFRALLTSVLGHFPEHLARLTTEFEKMETRHGSFLEGRWEWNENQLQETLSGLIAGDVPRQPPLQTIVVFIDALDECGQEAATKLLRYLKNLTDPAMRGHANFKVCISSRNYPILDLDTIPSVQVEERNGSDIQWYVRERLKDIKPQSKRKQIEIEMLSKSNCGFQWAFLMTRTIIDKNLIGIRAEQLLKELHSCPQTLSETYDTILKGVPPDDQHQMEKIFQWVLFAERPLSAQELWDALAIDKDMNDQSPIEVRSDGWLTEFERRVRHISGGLVHFQSRDIWEQYDPCGEDADREAQLIHQSVADFLLGRFVNHIGNQQTTISNAAGLGHLQISRSCLKYMTLKDMLRSAHLPRSTLSSKFPLAPYAVRFLFAHIQKVEQEGIPQPDLLSTIRWTSSSETIRNLATLWKTLDPESHHTPLGWPFIGATTLHVSAAFGSLSAVNMLLDSSYNEINSRDEFGNTPLMLAIRDGHHSIALALLVRSVEHKHQYDENNSESERRVTESPVTLVVDVNARNEDDDAALDIALDQKMGEIALRLIKAGAELKYHGQENALVAYAVSTRNECLLSLLIERRCDLHGVVFFALWNRLPERDIVLENMIAHLLSAEADTVQSLDLIHNFRSDDFDEEDDEDSGMFDVDALTLASRWGLTSVVEMLLKHNVKADAQNELGECPLYVATSNRHAEIIRMLLLEAPSSVEMEDDNGDTALDVATNHDEPEIIALLLKGGSFTAPNTALNDLLLDLARKGHIDAVEVILQRELVNPGITDGHGRTPLLVAAQYGHAAVVKQLLDTGKVDADAQDKDACTPLLLAAENGHATVVKQLLDTGRVHVDAQGYHGRTSLSLAARYGHAAVVKQLLDTGKVDADAQDKDACTPLLLAAGYGHAEVVKQLLETGKVDFDAQDDHGRTSLSLAARYGHAAVVKQLLDTGKVDADAHAHDKDMQTPLVLAARYGHAEVVKQLLETGKVDVDAQDDHGRTPLMWAITNGHDAVVDLLLNVGKVRVEAEDTSAQSLLLQAVHSRHGAIVKRLLDTGKFDINAKDDRGSTALSLAVDSGSSAVITALLSTEKLNANMISRDGRTPLSWAVRSGDQALVKQLLDSDKVNANAKDSDGSTPLFWAVYIGHRDMIIQKFLDSGKIDVNAANSNGSTLLVVAARRGHETLVSLLLETGKINHHAKDQNGRTALSWAAGNGHGTIVKLLLAASTSHADLPDSNGRTPLSWAVEKGHEEITQQLLVTEQVDPQSRDRHGRTPAFYARTNDHVSVLKLLPAIGVFVGLSEHVLYPRQRACDFDTTIRLKLE